jgi:hypothetical protein
MGEYVPDPGEKYVYKFEVKNFTELMESTKAEWFEIGRLEGLRGVLERIDEGTSLSTLANYVIEQLEIKEHNG